MASINPTSRNHCEVFENILFNLHFSSLCHSSQRFQGWNFFKGVPTASGILSCLHRVEGL